MKKCEWSFSLLQDFKDPLTADITFCHLPPYTRSEICVIKTHLFKLWRTSQKQNLSYMKGKSTTEQLLEVVQLEELPYFQNSEQINSTRHRCISFLRVFKQKDSPQETWSLMLQVMPPIKFQSSCKQRYCNNVSLQHCIFSAWLDSQSLRIVLSLSTA